MEEGQNQDELPLKRRVRYEDEEDRISRLPDCLLVEILSRLPDTKYAVRTGALSKRWKQMWTLVPNLVFAHHWDPSEKFVSFVDKILTQRGQSNLKKFSVHCSYDDQFESQVNNWIRYAIKCNVEELILRLFTEDESESEFWLDQFIFINSCFTDLTLGGCEFNPTKRIRWKKLRSLNISYAYLDEDLIKKILSGSPVLETLVLDNCYGYNQINITSKSVKRLVFYGYKAPEDSFDDYPDIIEINAPNILSLAIQDDLSLRKLLLVNVSSLVEAELDYEKLGYYEMPRKIAEEKMLKRLIINLRHVKEVKIGTYCFKALSRLKDKGFILPSNLKVCDASSCDFYSDDDVDDYDDYSGEFGEQADGDSDESSLS